MICLRRSRYFLMCIFVFLSGCVSAWRSPPQTEFNFKKNARIAIVNDVDAQPVERHIGFTVFENYRKIVDTDLNLRSRGLDYFIEKIESQLGYEVEVISSDDWKRYKGDGALYKDPMYNAVTEINDEMKPRLRAIAAETGYAAILFISGREYGTFTNLRVRQVNHAFAVTGISLDPPYPLGSGRKYDISVKNKSYEKEIFTALDSSCNSGDENIYLNCKAQVEAIIFGSLKDQIDRFVLRIPAPSNEVAN